jgi:hypothetical protein
MTNLINDYGVHLRHAQHDQVEQQKEKKIVFVGKYAAFARGNGDLIASEITTHIFGFLPAAALGLVRCVCRQWNNIASHDCLWKPFAHTDGFFKSPEECDSYAVFYQKCIRKEDALINSVILNLKKEKALGDRKEAELENNADEDTLSKINEEISQFKAEKETLINDLRRESSGISLFSKPKKREIQLKFLARIANDLNKQRVSYSSFHRISPAFFKGSNLEKQLLFIIVAQSGALVFLKELVREGKAILPTDQMIEFPDAMDLVTDILQGF